MFSKKNLWVFILCILIILLAADRYNWSAVAQWREDQATNLWLGYTQNLLAMPVGLISSAHIPNPNGMVLFGIALSRLPNLWMVSTVLGVIQGALILWIAWLLFGRGPLFYLACLPALASVVLRATSVEFWNQWEITSVNLLFWGLWIFYLRKPCVWKLPLLVLPVLFAPSMYLAGLVNAILFFVFMLIAVRLAPPQGSRKMWAASVLVGVIWIGLALWLTWIPYLKAVSGLDFPGMHLTFGDMKLRLVQSIESGLDFPVWNLLQWSQDAGDTFKQSSAEILSAFTTRSLRITRLMLFIQSAIFLGVFLVILIERHRKPAQKQPFFKEGYAFQGKVLLAGLGFVILSYMLSPLMGGPVWAEADRMDQQVQFLPFMLFIWFTFPFLVNLPAWTRKAACGLTPFVAAGFILISLVSGQQIIQAHLDYRGDHLSEADVPLRDKQQVVDFIARDWMKVTDEKQVPVSYDLGADRWDWVPESGAQMQKWYLAPMTMGRGLDYELLRVYGLKNSQEGVQFRTPASSRYIVTYGFLPAPSIPGKKMEEHQFGRLRVSIVQP